MRNKNVSIRGALVRDMIHDIMETSLGKPIQTGEFRKNPVAEGQNHDAAGPV